eukprot:scaffold3054_cov224-Chaetoceros_neogracile.AAC.2
MRGGTGIGYNLLDRHRKDQRRAYCLLLSSLIYFLAILLDRSLLTPQWKYDYRPGPPSTHVGIHNAKKLTVSKLPSATLKKESAGECESLLHSHYKDSHTTIETNGSPHPHTVVFAPPASQSIITKHLIKDGVWEPNLYRKIKQRIQPGMTFLDVGANMGLFSIYAQSLGANVIAVEAMHSNANFIRASECLNSFLGSKKNPSPVPPGNIYLYNYAAHPAPGAFDCNVKGALNNRDDGQIWCKEKNENHSKIIDSSPPPEPEWEPQLARLDSMIIDAVGPSHKIDLMKIDVEGFEQAVMESASELHPPPRGIVFECDAKQAKVKNHSTLFWRRYLKDHSDRCNGFTYSIGEEPMICWGRKLVRPDRSRGHNSGDEEVKPRWKTNPFTPNLQKHSSTGIMTDKASEEKEMTSDERLTYLRERGILVETAEDRRREQIKNIMNETDVGIDGEEYEDLKFVHIPHNESLPIKELSMKVPKNRSTSTRVAEQGQVETFTLVHPTESNKYISVNIYLDEVGMLKRLPLNKRAADIASKAGFNPAPSFHGDIFLGRIKEDTTVNVEWLRNATMANLEHQAARNEITGTNELQASADGEDGVAKVEKGYSWTQTDEEIEIVISLSSKDGSVITTKDVKAGGLKVKYFSKKMNVQFGGEELLSLQYFASVDPDGCTWTLDSTTSGISLVITCEKVDVVTWPRITA